MTAGRDSLHPHLAGLVLAAGGASRFGATKVLAQFRGEPLVVRAARLLAARCGAGCHVVIGADGDTVRAALHAQPVSLVDNPDWAEGLSTSLQAGVASLPVTAAAVLVLLADTPAIDEADIDRLIEAWAAAPERIAAARFGDTLGPPAVLPRGVWSTLTALQGDRGARSLIASPETLAVPMPHAAFDIDTPADLARLEEGPAQ